MIIESLLNLQKKEKNGSFYSEATFNSLTMNDLGKTVIIRHKKENLKKCSLRGLEQREDFLFLTYPEIVLPDLRERIILSMEAPPLSHEDRKYGLLLIDATWKLALKMENVLSLQHHPLRRSLPSFYRTAYPRRQNDCPDPTLGLASIEALYVAYTILGKEKDFLFEHYYWKEEFLNKNKSVIL